MILNICLLLLLSLAGVCDVLWHRIPNVLMMIGIGCNCVIYVLQQVGVLSFLIEEEPFGVRVALCGCSFTLGMVLYGVGVLGGGDSKLMSVVLLTLGTKGILVVTIGLSFSLLYGVVGLIKKRRLSCFYRNLMFYFRKTFGFLYYVITAERKECMEYLTTRKSERQSVECGVGTKVILAPGLAVAYFLVFTGVVGS